MDVLESVASGLLVALVVGLVRWGQARWRRSHIAAVDDHREENVPMGRPGKFTKPKVGPGSHQELIDLLYDLHLQAGGKLSVRRIAACTQLPHSTVHKALTRSDLPDLDVVVAIGLALADEARIPATDTDRETYLDGIDHRITGLWQAANREGTPPASGSVRAAVERTWSDFAHPEMLATNDRQKSAIARTTVLSTTMRAGVVTVLVAVPDVETRDCIEEPALWHAVFSERVSIRLQHHVGVTVTVSLPDNRPRPPLPRRQGAQPAVRSTEYVPPRGSWNFTVSLLTQMSLACRCSGHSNRRECMRLRDAEGSARELFHTASSS